MRNTTNPEDAQIVYARELGLDSLVKIIHRLDNEITNKLREIDGNQGRIQVLETEIEDLRRQIAEQ